jgi:ABC-type nitrate/sulfonate/bicarbonate transport system substrate-binding protein
MNTKLIIMVKQKIMFLIVVFSGLIFFFSGFDSFAQSEKKVFRVGVMPVCGHLSAVIAKKNFMETLKMPVVLDVYDSWTALEAAYRTGAVDAVIITVAKALTMGYDNVALKIIMVVSRNGSSLTLSGDSQQDVRGKIIGGSGNDTMELAVFSKFLEIHKLRMGYDVRYLLIPFNRATILLKEGAIYGYCLPEPYGEMAIKNKLAKTIILSKDIMPNHINDVLVVNPQVIKKYPQIIKELVQALIKASDFIENDKNISQAKQTALAQIDLLKMDVAIVRTVLTEPKDRVLFTNLKLNNKEINEIMNFLVFSGNLGGKVDLNKLIDDQFFN